MIRSDSIERGALGTTLGSLRRLLENVVTCLKLKHTTTKRSFHEVGQLWDPFWLSWRNFLVAQTVIIGDPFATPADTTGNQRKSARARREPGQGGA